MGRKTEREGTTLRIRADGDDAYRRAVIERRRWRQQPRSFAADYDFAPLGRNSAQFGHHTERSARIFCLLPQSEQRSSEY
ncbi:hypothetical protein C495_14592 [Natronorubrum sulfidifaciens JCM 14089]|uniref:Uncharacterized protein n=1 Tax=Natronorubrum sulfidifaciens JCM 14089 TaxID=1230460 RepID=L9VZE2_9EURY|nr:hypothetical protein C495_14592 [Natronorubrum sulfidifaciens JCM 14089]